MAKYVDGFVVPVPKKNVEEYRRQSRLAGKVWMEHGALEYRECIGEDLKIPRSMKGMVAFPRGVKAKPSETVMFSWIVYKSRGHRDRVNAKVMADPRMEKLAAEGMPFDMTRMMYGGFQMIVDV